MIDLSTYHALPKDIQIREAKRISNLAPTDPERRAFAQYLTTSMLAQAGIELATRGLVAEMNGLTEVVEVLLPVTTALREALTKSQAFRAAAELDAKARDGEPTVPNIDSTTTETPIN